MINLMPNWSVPNNIQAFTSTRQGGCSRGFYESNNFSYQVGDVAAYVQSNHQQLQEYINLPNKPIWLIQTHSNLAVVVDEDNNRQADAAITRCANQPIAIMTADCLPILLCTQEGNEVAAIHAGWRGLLGGIIEDTVSKLKASCSSVLAWLGPAICVRCFAVGPEVVDLFTQRYNFAANAFDFKEGRYYLDLAFLAKIILNYLGILAISHCEICTFENNSEFYSYRRSAQTGRMASVIWFTNTRS